MGILKNTGKFVLTLILSLIVYKFISYYLLGYRTKQETLSEAGHPMPKTKKTYIEQLLISTADIINKSCPKILDSTMTLLGATTFQGKTFQYNYSLNIDTSKYRMDMVKASIRKEILDKFINTEASKEFKYNKVTIVYYYIGTKGDFLFKLTFAPDKYE